MVTNPVGGKPETLFQKGHQVHKNGIRTWSRAETAAHLAYVEQLMLTPGMSDNRASEVCRREHDFGRGRYTNLKKRVQAQWLAQDEGDRPTARAAAVRRIMTMLHHARGQRSEDGRSWTRPPDHNAVRGYEKLLSDIQGTNAPQVVLVHHEMSSAISDVLGNLDPEQLQSCLDEWAELQRLAEYARAALPGVAAE